MKDDPYSRRPISDDSNYEIVMNADFELMKDEISESHSEERGWREDSRGEFLDTYNRKKMPRLINCYKKYGYYFGEFARKEIRNGRLFHFFMRHSPRALINFVKKMFP